METPSSTRTRVARAVLENGPSTASDLALGLGLTPAGVRRHLDALCAEGLLVARVQRTYGPRGRGRPARVFALTDAGRGAFFQAYDGLATDALRLLAEVGGEAAVERFARERVASLEDRCRAALDAQPERDRSEVLAEALSAEGYAGSVRSAPSGRQVCQHHCPVAHVAEEFPQLCEAETQVFARLLGTHVQRLATIAHGDGVCTTFVPHVPSPPTSSTTSRTGGTAA